MERWNGSPRNSDESEMCVRVCVRACVRVFVCACVRACVCARAYVHVFMSAPWQLTILTTQLVGGKTQITTNNVHLKSCHTHLSSLLKPICYCAQIIEACCVTYMIMVIDARISNTADQQILSNLFKDIKRSLSHPVTSRSQNTFT